MHAEIDIAIILRDEMIVQHGTHFSQVKLPRFAIGGAHVLSIPMSHDQNDRHCLTKQAYFRDANWTRRVESMVLERMGLV